MAGSQLETAGFRACGCLCCSVLLCGIISIIVVLASIKTLGPEDQAVIEYLDGKDVVNGPCTKVLNPFREKTYRKATRLGPLEYIRIKDALSGSKRVVEGPQLVFMAAYEDTEGMQSKYVLKKDQYIRFLDRLTGTERVIQGPQTIVPGPWEESSEDVQQAYFVNMDTAIIVLNKADGSQRLVTQTGVFFPSAYESIVTERTLIRVLPHETLVVRSALGNYVIHSGLGNGNGTGTSFFLNPYDRLVTMRWSGFSEPTSSPDGIQTQSSEAVERIDMRAQKVFYQYEVRTNDNVNLRIEGTIFWKVVDAAKMVNITADPSGDVWYKARSALISSVSKVTLAVFMSSFNSIVTTAFQAQAGDGFYSDRGLEVHSMEVTKYDCVDEETAQTLQEIIEETTNRINRLQAQRSENDVKAAKLQADITLELQRTQLILTQAKNERLVAEKAGEASGAELAKSAVTFFDGLNSSLPNIDDRVSLYKLHKRLESQNIKTQHVSQGTGKLFLTPEDIDLQLSYQDL